MEDRRQHPRTLVSECCIVRVEIPVNQSCLVRVEGTGKEVELDGVVTNVSEFGMRIHLDEPIPAATTVTVLLANHLIVARVVHCKSENGVFAVGLSITSASADLRKLCRQRFKGEPLQETRWDSVNLMADDLQRLTEVHCLKEPERTTGAAESDLRVRKREPG